MVGRWREKKAAERLGKPVSGNVTDGMGTVGGSPGEIPGSRGGRKTKTDVGSLFPER
jgi:hypothetical protein